MKHLFVYSVTLYYDDFSVLKECNDFSVMSEDESGIECINAKDNRVHFFHSSYLNKRLDKIDVLEEDGGKTINGCIIYDDKKKHRDKLLSLVKKINMMMKEEVDRIAKKIEEVRKNLEKVDVMD